MSKEAQDNYTFYKKEAEAAACRREYVTSRRYDVSPYWYARESLVQGEIAEEETDVYYEFDSLDRLCVAACDDLINGYAYTAYNDNRIITRLYVSGVLESVKVYAVKDGFIKQSIEYIPRLDKYNEEQFEYDGNAKLIQIYQPQYDTNPCYYQHLVRTYFEYAENGSLSRVLDGTKGVIYLTMEQAEAEVLRETVKAELISSLNEMIGSGSKSLADKKCCFLAIFLHGDPAWVTNPIFHPGLDEIRERIIQNDKDLWVIWNSGEHPIHNQQQLTDQNVMDKLRTLIYFWHNTENWWEEGVKLWQEVAYAVNERDAFHNEMLSDDFIVFVDWEGIDVTGGELEANFPPSILDRLRSKGLLPD